MARFSDLHDYIVPSVRGCEMPAIDFEIRKALRDWQRSTTQWRERIPLTMQPGITDYRLVPSNGGVVAGVISMPHPTDAGRTISEAPESMRWPTGYVADAGTPSSWFQLYPGVITFNRPPDVAYPMIVDVYKQIAQDPDDDAFPDDEFEHNASDIASGVLAQLLAQPAKPWRDLTLATYHNTVFTKAKLALRAKLRRGGGAGSMRVAAPRFAGRY